MSNILKENINKRYIGLTNKSYEYMVDTLKRNIGSLNQGEDKYGTPIGMLASTDNGEHGWFYKDARKKAYYDYIGYVEKEYYQGTKNIVDYITADVKMSNFNNNNLNLNNSIVGVVRDYGHSNPNGSTDTNVGYINNFYLKNTIQNTIEENKKRAKKSDGITNGLSYLFSVDGDYGMTNNNIEPLKGRPRTQNEILGNLIPWSTVDSYYNSLYASKHRVANMVDTNDGSIGDIFSGVSARDISEIFGDTNLNSGLSNIYDPFGNFYSITYSLGIISASTPKTQDFITKSLLGYDLLENHYQGLLSLDFLNDNNVAHPRQKYYVSNGSRGTNYIDAIVGVLPSSSASIETAGGAKAVRYDGSVVRTDLFNAGNSTLWAAKTLWQYAESEGMVIGSPMGSETITSNSGANYGTYKQYAEENLANKKDLLNKTNKHFKQHHFDTIIGRFHTDKLGSVTEARANTDIFTTAISQYGMSHGRNLLKKNPTIDNGYSNPYCRVWTYHHQYKSLQEAIRPFSEGDGDEAKRTSLADSELEYYRATGEGSFNGSMITRLEELGVKSKTNGQVKFTTLVDDDGVKLTNRAEKCMFSIENLAWKGLGRQNGQYALEDEQKGPLGGRIMWFPPYDLKFNEDTVTNWHPTQIIGRGEQMYTYINTERSGSLSFTLLIDHPSIINGWRGNVDGGDAVGDVDDINSNEQQLLRFFAGCEVLEKRRKLKPIKSSLKNEGDKKIISQSIPSGREEKFSFFVFFPNNYTGIDDSDNGVNPIEYLLNGVGGQKIKSDDEWIDLPTQMNKQYFLDGEKVGGYEVHQATKGVSVVKNITSPDGKTLDLAIINDGNKNIQIGKYFTDKQPKGDNRPRKNWAYRIDNNYITQSLSNDDYYDLKSYGLNGANYVKAFEPHGIGVNEQSNFYSLADVYGALTNKGKDVLGESWDESNIQSLKNILKTYKVTRVLTNGYASTDGYDTINRTELAPNRAKTVKDWMCKSMPNVFHTDMFPPNGMGEVGENSGSGDPNTFNAKVWRCVKVDVYYSVEDVEDTMERVLKQPTTVATTNTYKPSNINLFDNLTALGVNNTESIVNKILNSGINSITEGELREYIELLQNPYSNSTNLTNVQLKAIGSLVERVVTEIEAESMKTGAGVAYAAQHKEGNRYKDEYRFFSELKINEPFMHSKLVEKIKYFDPAFHSVTPEGFNARLTFLQQCCRQGATNGNSDNTLGATADNLAFGRPPVCVLRLGDFFYTKIIIEGLSIDYNESTWDLNDEGVGVMPMMAKITLRFKFLGGSDLGGPITRLQNAVSFNYYANTGVYDNRSEMVKYNEQGEIGDFKSTTIK